MADKLLVGAPPPADVANFPEGTVWFQIWQVEADATRKTFKLSIWSQIGVNQIDWGDSNITSQPAFTAAPAGDGLLGRTDATHAYAGRGGSLYQIMFEAGGLRRRYTVQSGIFQVVDDVTREGLERPPKETMGDVFRERGQVATSVRKQMTNANPPSEGGMVNR